MIKAACAIVINDDGKVLISKRSKGKKEYPGVWEMPGGKFEDGENVDQCIKREIKEELDIDVEFIKLLCCYNVSIYNVYYCLCYSKCENIKFNSEIENYKLIDIENYKNYDMIENNHNIIEKYLTDIQLAILNKKIDTTNTELELYKSLFKTHKRSVVYNLKIKKKNGKKLWIDKIHTDKMFLKTLDQDAEIIEWLKPKKCEKF